jgi:GDPmannose 4,6-dehydratase
MKKVMISGATGQDGSYMAEYLLENTDNTIILLIRRTSQAILSNLTNVIGNPRVKMLDCDLSDGESIRSVIRNERPDYFMNFGASAFVADSWLTPALVMNVNATSLIHILEAVREYCPLCRVYQAGSSEMFGDVVYSPQDEKHPLRPRSVYGVSKVAAKMICKVYRESYNLYSISGYLFNHESSRRGVPYISRKLTHSVARIKKAMENGESFEPISVGNIYARRDWSYAPDFIDGIWRMMNQDVYRDNMSMAYDYLLTSKNGELQHFGYNKEFLTQLNEYVLSSNETHTVKELIEKAFHYAGIEGGKWSGEGVNEIYTITYPKFCRAEKVLVKIDPKFYRPADVELLLGDSTKARKELDWKPKVGFDELVKLMVENDINLLNK